MIENDFLARVAAAEGNAEAIGALLAELGEIQAPWVRGMQFRLIAAKLRLRPPSRPAPVPAAAPQEGHWLDRFGLQQPDGRPLYGYRMSRDSFETIAKHLRSRAGTLAHQVTDRDSALFVIWGAEWFRRSYAGGGEQWATLCADIGLSCNQSHLRRLTDRGLRFWRIKALTLNGTHHRLVSLARQGGFPLAALGDGTTSYSGWAATYLERLVGALLNEPREDHETALAMARGLSDLIPQTWANDGMMDVCADLAIAVVHWRRAAEAAGIADGTLAITWLDAHHSEWRDELPFAVDNSAAQALLGGLMRTKALKGTGGTISVRRILTFVFGRRREQLELLLDGTLSSDDPDALKQISDTWSRLRLYAAGSLARFVGGELGVAVPADDGTWVVRPSTTRLRFDVPFAVAAEVELRGEGVRVAGPFAMPRGTATNGCLLVLREEGERYVVEGTGSGGYRAEKVFIEVPGDWRVEPKTSESGCAPCETADDRQLFQVWGELRVQDPEDESYLIRTGQTAEHRDRLVVMGRSPPGCRAVDDKRLICGTPQLWVGSDRSYRNAGVDGWWRRAGERGWNKLDTPIPPGLIVFAWRDRQTFHIRATETVAVLPTEFAVDPQVSGENIELRVTGWPGSITSSTGLLVQPGRWRLSVIPKDAQPLILTLADGEMPPIKMNVSLPQRAWIHDWTRGPAARGERISLPMLHRYVARASGRCELMADLLDRNRRVVAQGKLSWVVEDELAMAAIEDDIAALIRPLGDIDASVRLDFHDGYTNNWFVSEFEYDLRWETGGYIPSPAIASDDVRIMGRSLSNPSAPPQELGHYSVVQHRPFSPPELDGDWLLYLKGDDRIMSRPRLHRGVARISNPPTALARAMAVDDFNGRSTALCELCDAIVAEPLLHRQTLQEIIDLALNLEGLPPATFDILMRMKTHAALGAHLLFTARRDAVERIWRLTDHLPFVWVTIPKAAWDAAARCRFQAMIAEFPDGAAEIGGDISQRRREIAALEPALAPMLDLSAHSPSLRDVANAFANRSHDRIRLDIPNPFRPQFTSELPHWSLNECFWRALDAPVVAGRAAQGRITPDEDQVRCIKEIQRTHPRWFTDGYIAALNEG